jgi:hypothetical protein
MKYNLLLICVNIINFTVPYNVYTTSHTSMYSKVTCSLHYKRRWSLSRHRCAGLPEGTAGL